MARFRMEQQLPSTVVTPELVKSIERLIAKQIDALAANEDKPESLRTGMKVVVTDALGIETMQSIDELGPTKFPDTTTLVGVYFHSPWDISLTDLEVEVQFYKDRTGSRVKVSCDGANARVLAQGISRSVYECIAPHKSGSQWIHPRPLLDAFVFIATWVTLGLSGWTVGAKSYRWVTIWITLAAILGLYQLLPALRPYTIFDSRAADSRAKWLDWVVKGLLGFLIFGIILTLAKEHFLKALGWR